MNARQQSLRHLTRILAPLLAALAAALCFAQTAMPAAAAEQPGAVDPRPGPATGPAGQTSQGGLAGEAAPARNEMIMPARLQASGIIASIDPRRERITVDEQATGRAAIGRATPFDLANDASISNPAGRRGLQLLELKPGDRVTIAYRQQGGKNLAEAVMVNPPVPTTPEVPAGAE